MFILTLVLILTISVLLVVYFRKSSADIVGAPEIMLSAEAISEGEMNNENHENTEELEIEYIEFSVPNINTSFKTYMHYGAITNKSSAQWRLQQQAWTGNYGFRLVDDFYCVALGTYYSRNIGDKFIITLDSGHSFKAIMSDIKQDRHTDSTHRYVPKNGNVVEFVVDTRSMDKYAKRMGSMSVINGFGGNVVKIEKMVLK